MYVPFSSERSAFWIVIGLAGLMAVSVAIGALTAALAGVVLFAVGAIEAIFAWVIVPRGNRGSALRLAAQAYHPAGHPLPGVRRVLVVANDTLSDPEVSDEITLAAGAAELDILAPVRLKRSHYLLSDYDEEAAEAHSRLDASLAWATANGFDAHGEVGDPDPVNAVADELRDFGADAVIVVKHPRDSASWLESRTLKRLRAALDVPVKEIAARRPG